MNRLWSKFSLISVMILSTILSACGGSSILSSTTAITATSHPKVELLSASVINNVLILQFQVHGLQMSSAQEIDDIVCRPYIDTQENVPLSFFYSETHIADTPAQGVKLTYKYYLDPPLPRRLHLNILLTIGPCGPDFQESNVPPSSTNLVASYKIQTEVSIP